MALSKHEMIEAGLIAGSAILLFFFFRRGTTVAVPSDIAGFVPPMFPEGNNSAPSITYNYPAGADPLGVSPPEATNPYYSFGLTGPTIGGNTINAPNTYNGGNTAFGVPSLSFGGTGGGGSCGCCTTSSAAGDSFGTMSAFASALQASVQAPPVETTNDGMTFQWA